MKVYIVGVDTGSPSGLLASLYMEKELNVLGYQVEQFPAKDADSLMQALMQCAQPDALILCPLSGNLPADAACIHAASQVCQKPLALNPGVAAHLVKRTKLSEQQAEQLACLPQDARVFPCHQSALPGFEVSGGGFHIVALPSDQQEQTSLFFGYLFQILKKASDTPCCVRVARVMELNAGQVEAALEDLLAAQHPCVAVYAKRSEVIVRICDNAEDRQQAAQNCNAALKTVEERLGSCIYGIDVNSIEHAVAARCAQKNIRLAFAESGSSGLAAKRFSNADSEGKLVFSTYSCRPEQMDLEKLGINEKIGKTFGPVSANVAAALALGASKQKEKELLGLSISLPNSSFKSRKAYIAAVLDGVCMMEELDAGAYHSLTQMTADAVARLFNLARKMLESYPQPPQGSCDAEQAVLQGMDVVPHAQPAAVQMPQSQPAAGHRKKGKKAQPKEQPQQNQPAPKAPKGIKGIFYRIFPNRDDSKFDKVRKILLWVCLCVFIGSITYLVDFGAQNKKSQENIASLQSQMEKAEQDVADGKINASNIEGYPNDYLPKFYPFYLENDDIKGWLKIDGTNVNFPVVQTSDNDYYHRLGFNEEYDYYGTPYIDWEADVKKPSTNITIYGHNIRNDGQMFNDLTKYKQLSFYKEHPLVSFDSVYKEGTYKIFAAFITNNLAEHDNGNKFYYNAFVDAKDEADFNNFVNEVKRRSIFDTPVDVEYGDELLTLSTCTYEFKDARFVLVARRVRDGEDTKVDVEQAVVNDDAYYPAVYAGAAEYAKKLGKVKSITIDGQREITLEVGQTATLTASVKPADAPIKTCSWDSSNTSVATIDSSTGVVTAVGAGTTQITASADDGGFVDNITVTVKGNGLELKGISLSSTALNLKPQQTATLNAVLDPEGAQASLNWKSSDESIVRVSGNGASAQLTAVNAGSAQVTVSSSDGKFTAACQITVSTSSQEAPGIVFAQTNMSLTVGQPQNISLTITPSGADVGKISWNASSDAISVQEGYNGTDVVVTGVKAGTAVLTASTESGLQASCTITVKEEGSTDATGQVKLSVSPLVLNAGEEGQLQYAVDPSGTQLTFTSSDPRIADVNDKGYVTTIIHLDQTTDVTITVKTADGSASAQTTVTVMAAGGGSSQGSQQGQQGGQTQDKDQNQGSSQEQGTQADLGLYSESSWESVEVGYTKLLPLHVGLAEGDVTIKCSSSDRSIAQVDNEGMVTGVGPGSATITITATDNNTGDYQTITVEVEVEGSGFGYGTSDPQPDEEDDSRSSGERG